MALSLYNKYRPQTFKDVVGQDHVEKTLINAVEKNKVSHAYLFCGPRGTGKTTTARILAKALLCNKAPTATPDGSCEQCREISEGIHPDVYELDAASRTGVDNVREEIIGRVSFAPTHGSHKIYIIDEVHMLSTAAFNALLKTLEEPPSHVVFVLCTTDVHKVPDTVQARCQRFDFKPLAASDIVGRLRYICEREGFDAEPAALELIALRSRGGMRDAIRSLEQAAVFSGGTISYAAAESLLGIVDAQQILVLCDRLAEGDAAAAFSWVAGYVQSGSDIAILVNDLAAHLRNLYAVRVSQGTDEQLASALEIDASSLPRLREQALRFSSPDRLAWMLTQIGSLSAELRNAANARLALEIALTRIVRPESELSLEALAARLAQLEARLAAGGAGTTPREAAALPAMPGAPAGSVGAPATTERTAGAEESGPVFDEPPEDPGSVSPGTDGAPSDAACEDEGQKLWRQWNSVVDAVKQEKRSLAANLGGAAPLLSSDGTRLTIELPAGAGTSKQSLSTDANRTLLSKAVDTIFGRPMNLAVSVAAQPAASAPPEPETEPEPAPFEPPPVPFPVPQPQPTGRGEPSKEELDSILSTSMGSPLQFEDHVEEQ
ncbi:MAG: DNA polymerase III subunit gamma/tau [Coriobacteriales bacterium]|nr:DNA polymerase III subunit gamma/tau [Coriobacteriales bacterium]